MRKMPYTILESSEIDSEFGERLRKHLHTEELEELRIIREVVAIHVYRVT
jgi:hypothetical protein